MSVLRLFTIHSCHCNWGCELSCSSTHTTGDLLFFLSMAELGTSTPRRIAPTAPTPVAAETTVRKVRRFAVEPVETTSRSNRREQAQQLQHSVMVEEIKVDVPTKRRFAPEPIETTTRSSKQSSNITTTIPTPEPTPTSTSEGSLVEESPKPRRKFVPELIETSKRSKRVGDARPATLHTDKV